MFHGGFNTLMQMVSMAQIVQDEEFNELCAAQLPAGGLRQPIVHALTWLRQTVRAQQPATQIDLLDLATANQALEARVGQLERQLAPVLTTPP